MSASLRFSRPSQTKAIEIAKLLLDLSNSDKTPCIATKLRLRECERTVSENAAMETGEEAWDGLLELLKGLAKGKKWIRLYPHG
jgi:hypothetical protein